MAYSHVTLRSGSRMPLLGLGTYGISKGETKNAVMKAMEVGYRHIDCAFDYENEVEVGEAIQAKIQEGQVKRDDLFITSKLWLTYFAPDRVKLGFEKSLKMLKLDYLDLYLLHFPFAMKPEDQVNGTDLDSKMDDIDYVDTWKELIKLKESGLAKSIGVSNFNQFQVNRLSKETAYTPDVNQFECHPYLNQEKLVKFCQAEGIVATAYSPLGSSENPDAQKDLFNEPALQAIAKKYGKTVPQVILRYQVQRNVVVIPKSKTPSRIESNAQIFDFSLSDDDMGAIRALNKDLRLMDVDGWASKNHKYYPFRKDYSE